LNVAYTQTECCMHHSLQNRDLSQIGQGERWSAISSRSLTNTLHDLITSVSLPKKTSVSLPRDGGTIVDGLQAPLQEVFSNHVWPLFQRRGITMVNSNQIYWPSLEQLMLRTVKWNVILSPCHNIVHIRILKRQTINFD
jgi:hypothetical protein